MYDVAVIGGGPAGASAALMLARAGRTVALIDRATPGSDFKIGEGLPPAARPLLRDLGVLPSSLSGGHLPSYGNESAWGRSSTTIHDFIRDPNGHGWHLDRIAFEAMMRRLAIDAGAAFPGTTRLHRFARNGATWRLTIKTMGEQDQELRARWLVDASGRAAYVARRLGATTTHDDQLVAIASLYAPRTGATPDRDSFTLTESVPDGWWYTALLPNQQRVVVFVTDSDLDARRLAATTNGFTQLLNQTKHVRARLAASTYTRNLGPLRVRASSSRLAPASGERWVAIGDAAVTFDPLSSQGIMTALYSGLRTAAAIDAELSGNAGKVAQVTEDLDRVHTAYKHNRRLVYTQEQRWVEYAFWRRRQQ